MARITMTPNSVLATLTASGTPQQISASPLLVQSVLIEAHASNTGNIKVGWSAAKINAGEYHTLVPGGALEFVLDDTGADADLIYMDLEAVYFDGINTGDKVIASYVNETAIKY